MIQRSLFLLVLCATLTFMAACKTARPQSSDADWVTSAGELIEDTGRRLSGDYIVRSITDDYNSGSVQASPRWSFSFKEDGSFQSERESGGAMRVETGSYVLSTQNALVLFIEAVGGNALSEARADVYKIESQSDSELRLRHGGSVALVLRKK
jgi:hypothetical protein